MYRPAPATRIAALSFFAAMNCAKPEPEAIREIPPEKTVSPPPPVSAYPMLRDADSSVNSTPAYVSLALKNPKIVVLGDSILAGFGGLVAKSLAESINAGDAGFTASAKDVTKGAQTLQGWIGSQFDAHVPDPKYNIIVLEGGVNDIATLGRLGKKADREDAFVDLVAKLDGMVRKCVENRKVVVLVTVSPWKRSYYWSEEGQGYTERLNDWMRRQPRPGVFVADTYAALSTKNPSCEKERDTLEPGYRGGDIQHPNAAGKKRIAETVAESLGFTVSKTGPEGTVWTSACK